MFFEPYDKNGKKYVAAIGQSGKGHIFDYGAAAKPILKDFFGSVYSNVTWRIKSIS